MSLEPVLPSSLPGVVEVSAPSVDPVPVVELAESVSTSIVVPPVPTSDSLDELEPAEQPRAPLMTTHHERFNEFGRLPNNMMGQ